MVNCVVPQRYFAQRNKSLAYTRGFSDRCAGGQVQHDYKVEGCAQAYREGWASAEQQIKDTSRVDE